MKKIIPVVLLIVLSACSTANIAKRGEYIETSSIKLGTPRLDLLARFDTPLETKINNKDGKRIDLFRVPQGETTSGKVLKGGGTILLAIWSLGLSEIVADPVTESQPMVIFEVFYDKNDRVEKRHFIELPK